MNRLITLLKKHPLFWLALLLNILGVVIGLYYYGDQMSATAPLLLVFVPDCPLYVLFALFILLGLINRDDFSFLVAIGMVKYGIWTLSVFAYFWQAYFTPAALFVTLIFILGHSGMATEGIALIPKKKVNLLVLLFVLGWFLLSDYVDYFVGTMPPAVYQVRNFFTVYTIALTLLVTFAVYFYGDKLRELPGVSFIRDVISARPLKKEK